MTEARDRVKKSLMDLKQAGGRMLSVRLSPQANAALKKEMDKNPGKTLTQCVNRILEDFHREKQSEK